MSQSEVFIYGLIDPRTHEVRYVGQTGLSLKRRLQAHVTAAKQQKTLLHLWITKLLPLVPVPVLLETVWADMPVMTNKRTASDRAGGQRPVRLASVMEAKWLKRFRRTVLNVELKQCNAYDEFTNSPELQKRYGVKASKARRVKFLKGADLDPSAEYSVRELAAKLNVSSQTVTRIFAHRLGVHNIPGRGNQTILRIPGHIAQQWLREVTEH
jgi:hypothetical protein